MSEVIATGSCLCGGVRYQVTGPVHDVTACHCTQCRKQSGHFWASSWAADEDFELLSEDGYPEPPPSQFSVSPVQSSSELIILRRPARPTQKRPICICALHG